MAGEPIVFVVDEEPDVRDSMAAVLESDGFAVETYASADQFLQAFDRAGCGCLIADARMNGMNGMNGLELLEHLRAEGIALPVIIVAARAEVRTAVRAIRSGAVTFLEKPCADADLCTNVRKALQQQREYRAHRTHQENFQSRLARLKLEVKGHGDKTA